MRKSKTKRRRKRRERWRRRIERWVTSNHITAGCWLHCTAIRAMTE